MTQENSQERQYFRIPDCQGIPVQISLQDNLLDFQANLWGLVFDESAKGCGLVIVSEQEFQVDQVCCLKFPDLSPLRTRIAWFQSIKSNIILLGLEYLGL
jgi:hypothetical protein